MATFWAYENWRAHGHRVTVHRADCSFCAGGKGIAGGTHSDNGKWHHLGDFVSSELALSAARRVIRLQVTRLCGKCSPSSSSVPRPNQRAVRRKRRGDQRQINLL